MPSEAGAPGSASERLPIKTHVPHIRNAMANVDFKRLGKRLAGELAAAPPYSSQRNYGAGTLEWCYLAAGRFDLYLHGGQKLWDYAAGSLILEEAGGRDVHADPRRLLGRRSVAALGHRRARSGAVPGLEDWIGASGCARAAEGEACLAAVASSGRTMRAPRLSSLTPTSLFIHAIP